MDDGRRPARLRHRRLALDPGTRPVHGVLERALAHGVAFEPDRQARGIHHDEHVFQAAIRLAHQVTFRAVLIAEGQHAGGARVDSELVLDRHAADFVAGAERAILVHQHLSAR